MEFSQKLINQRKEWDWEGISSVCRSGDFLPFPPQVASGWITFSPPSIIRIDEWMAFRRNSIMAQEYKRRWCFSSREPTRWSGAMGDYTACEYKIMPLIFTHKQNTVTVLRDREKWKSGNKKGSGSCLFADVRSLETRSPFLPQPQRKMIMIRSKGNYFITPQHTQTPPCLQIKRPIF